MQSRKDAAAAAAGGEEYDEMEELPYPYNRFAKWITGEAREMILRRARTLQRTRQSERNEQDFHATRREMAELYTVHLPQYVRLASVKHPEASIREQMEAARESIVESLRAIDERLRELKERLGVRHVGDFVKLVAQEQGKRDRQQQQKGETAADDSEDVDMSVEARGEVLENLNNYGQLFAQHVMSQYIDETVKNPTAKLRYSEMVIDKTIGRIDSEQFLMAAGTMFGDMGEHTLGIKVFKRLRDLEPDNAINLFNLALQYEAKGMYDHAISSFEKLHTDGILPSRVTLLKLSKCYESTGRYKEAVKYHSQYTKELLETLREAEDEKAEKREASVTISGQKRGVSEQESVEVLLDLGYLHTMAEQFSDANKTFRMALEMFPHHSIIVYQWLVSMRSQERFVQQLEDELNERIERGEAEGVLMSEVENERIRNRISAIRSEIEQSLKFVKESLANMREISVVNKILVDLCHLQVSILEKRPTKECWKHVVEACNNASTRDNQELVVYELTNFLYERKNSKEFDDFKPAYNAFLLQFISQSPPIFTDNATLWSRLRKLTGRPCSVDDARSLLLVLKIEDKETQDVTFRKYHLVAKRDKEERVVQFAVDFEALIQKEISMKEIVIHECQATLTLDENIAQTIGPEEEIYTGIFNVGPLLEKDGKTEVTPEDDAEPTN